MDNSHQIGTAVPPHEVTRRLAEHRCVWCGFDLPDRCAPDDLFDREACQIAWRSAVLTDPLSGGVDVDREAVDWETDLDTPPPGWLGDQRGILRELRTQIPITQAELDAIPVPPMTEVPALQLGDLPPRSYATAGPATASAAEPVAFWSASSATSDLGPVCPEAWEVARRQVLDVTTYQSRVSRLTIHNGPDLPEQFDYTYQDVYPAPCDYSLREAAPQSPPSITVTPQAATAGGSSFAISSASWIPGLPVLSETDPPPEPALGWNLTQIERLEREGFRVAFPQMRSADLCPVWDGQPPPLRPTRRCPRCRQDSQPVAITGLFPTARHALFGAALHTPEPGAEHLRMTKLCCAACRLPYPGPTIVPMARPPERSPLAAWAFAAFTTRAYMTRHVGVRAMDLTQVDLHPLVWGELYEHVLEAGSAWMCCLPDCGVVARVWLMLAGTLNWRGWSWHLTDALPLRMGLCPQHNYDLRYDLSTWALDHTLFGWDALMSSDGRTLMP